MNNLEQAFSDPQILHQEMVIESDQPTGTGQDGRFPGKIVGHPRRIGTGRLLSKANIPLKF